MDYAIAMHYRTKDGMDNVKAFIFHAQSRDEALGLAMVALGKIDDVSAVYAWDVQAGTTELEQLAHDAYGIGRSRIPAIKAIRAATGWGLKESKVFVDRVVNYGG